MSSINLLSMNITNIKLDYNMKDAEVTAGTNQKAQDTRSVTPAKMDVYVKNAFVHIDTTAARSSLDQDTMETFHEKRAQKAYQTVLKVTEEYVSMGNQIGRLYEKPTIAQIYKSKFNRDELQMQTAVKFVPSSPAEITVDPYECTVENTPAQMNVSWSEPRFSLGFVPGSFDQIVTQEPNVDIQYLGEPHYV